MVANRRRGSWRGVSPRGGVVDQSPLLQGLVDMGRVETFQWVTGLVLLEYLAEEGKLTLFLVGRDIIAIGIDVTKQGNI